MHVPQMEVASIARRFQLTVGAFVNDAGRDFEMSRSTISTFKDVTQTAEAVWPNEFRPNVRPKRDRHAVKITSRTERTTPNGLDAHDLKDKASGRVCTDIKLDRIFEGHISLVIG